MKSVKSTIKILMKSNFSSDLTHFLTIIGGGGAAQSNIGEVSRDSGTPTELNNVRAV